MRNALTLCLIIFCFGSFAQKQKENIYGKWILAERDSIDSTTLNNIRNGFLYCEVMTLMNEIKTIEINKKNEILLIPRKKNGVIWKNTFQLSTDRTELTINLINNEKEIYQIHFQNKSKLELSNQNYSIKLKRK